MLQIMNKSLISSLLLSMLLFASSAGADLYKGLDNEGNIIYSDKPFADAKKITPPSLTILDPPRVKISEETADKNVEQEQPEEFKYTDFDIVSPANNETIWNDPNLNVSLNLKPGLNTAEGHTIWLLINNKPLIKNGSESSYHIGYVNRGTHQLQAQVRDRDGKIIARTRTTLIYVKHTSVLHNKPR